MFWKQDSSRTLWKKIAEKFGLLVDFVLGWLAARRNSRDGWIEAASWFSALLAAEQLWMSNLRCVFRTALPKSLRWRSYADTSTRRYAGTAITQ
jgi:hypothetical protein